MSVRCQAITWSKVDQDVCHYMRSLGHNELNTARPGHNGQILQSTFTFPWKFHLSLFLTVQWQEVSTGSGNGSVPIRSQAISWTNSDPDVWHHMVSLGHPMRPAQNGQCFADNIFQWLYSDIPGHQCMCHQASQLEIWQQSVFLQFPIQDSSDHQCLQQYWQRCC